MNENIVRTVAAQLKISAEQVKKTLDLMEEGGTVPFIARYRKNETGNLDEEQILFIEKQYKYEQKLADRKEAVLKLRSEGVKIGLIRPITLYPFPKKSIETLDYDKVKCIIDIEMTIPAQMRDDIELQVKGRCPVYEYGRSGGCLLDDESVYEAICDIIDGGEE